MKITKIGQTVMAPAALWERVLDDLDDNLTAWEGEEDSVKEEHAELIERLNELDVMIAVATTNGRPTDPDPSDDNCG